MTFTPAESDACKRLVRLAFREDVGARGDVTSKAIIPEEVVSRAVFVARASGVIAGLPAAMQVAAVTKPLIHKFEPYLQDGDRVERGTQLAIIAGPMRSLLIAERTALNFLQHLSGIATLTRQYVDAITGLPCKILDTRKTTPGWRLLEKYAVRQGGGHNHRLSLYDGVLIKDNHLAALGIGDRRSQIEVAIQRARALPPPLCNLPLGIEVDDLAQLDAALACLPEIILLDNMSLEDLREACRRRARAAPETLLEASGGVTLQTVRAIAETGVDRISVGALTHSAPALDIALDYE